MSNRIYSAFDPAALGAGLELSQSNTIVTVAQTVDIHRTVRGLYGKNAGSWYAEFVVWGNAALAGNVYIGVVDASAGLDKYVGEDAHGWGYGVGDGKIKTNNADVATVAIGSKSSVIGLQLTSDGDSDGSLTVVWYLDNVAIYSQSLDFGVYFPAVSIASPFAGSDDVLNCFFNAGGRPFEFNRGTGWYDLLPQIPAIRFATDDFIDLPTADVPHAVFEARVKSDSRMSIAKTIGFWPDGESSTRSGVLQLSVLNSDGMMDALLASKAANIATALYSVDDAGVKSKIASLQFDSASVSNDNTINLSFTDGISALERPLQSKLTLPSVLEASANKPWPIVLGAPRSVPLLLLDSINLVYAVSSVPVGGVGYIRDKGDPWDPNASPPDFVLSSDRRTIIVDEGVAPQGIVTGDFSSIGGGTQIAPEDDITNGAGDPFVVSAGVLVGWDVTEPFGGITYGSGFVLFTTTPDSASFVATTNILLSGSGHGLTKGKLYRYEIDFQFIGVADNIMEATLQVYGGLISGQPYTPLAWSNREPVYGGSYSFDPQTHEGTFVATSDCTTIGLRFTGTARGFSCKVTKFKIIEIPDVYLPSLIEPIKFEPFVRAILIDIAGIGVDEYDSASAAAIDSATGYSGIGFWAEDGITVRDALEKVSVGYGVSVYQNGSSEISFIRLSDPEGGVSSASIDQSDMMNEMQKEIDFAPGLSTRMGYRKNWQKLSDSDFVTDFIDVPRSTRRALSSPYQGIVASSVQLAPLYRNAIQADPVESLLDSKEDAQAEIDRICAIYSKTRAYYKVNVSNPSFSVGDVVTVTYPRYGLESGKKLLVKSVVLSLVDNVATVQFWGAA